MTYRSSVFALLLATTGLAWQSQSLAATVFVPTNPDVNVIRIASIFEGFTLGIFDDQDQTYSSGQYLSLNTIADTVVISPQPGGTDYLATSAVTSNSLNLLGSAAFIFGLSLDGGSTWVAETYAQQTSPGSNIYNLAFNGVIVAVVDVQAVPLPAAVWLFLPALMGLFGVARKTRRLA